eukprot:scaffold15234_cov31-Tisochrysis_lutea.AAC.4
MLGKLLRAQSLRQSRPRNERRSEKKRDAHNVRSASDGMGSGTPPTASSFDFTFALSGEALKNAQLNRKRSTRSGGVGGARPADA